MNGLLQVLRINSGNHESNSCSESLCAGLHVDVYQLLADLPPQAYRNSRLINFELILTDMKFHLNTASVQQWACTALNNMASDEKYCVRIIGICIRFL